MEEIYLTADSGYIYTDGITTYGYKIRVADGVDKSKFYQITVDEYRRIEAEKAAKLDEILYNC